MQRRSSSDSSQLPWSAPIAVASWPAVTRTRSDEPPEHCGSGAMAPAPRAPTTVSGKISALKTISNKTPRSAQGYQMMRLTEWSVSHSRMCPKKRLSVSLLLVGLSAALPADAADTDHAATRYPTSDEAFYVMACIEANGQNAEALQKCSCAINAIEGQLSYQEYSDASLVFAMRQGGGERAALYRDSMPMREIADRFTRAQASANRQCFGRDGGPTK
jgi:hypothetical protein